MITIAVDAMGGDNAPRPEVEGSVLAAREFGVRILLVGQPTVVRAELAKHATPNLPIEVVPASEVITMDDHPAQAFRRKKDSSVHVAARLVRETKADGLVSAGNTGAVMTVAGGFTPEAFRMAWLIMYPVWAVALVGIVVTRRKARRLDAEIGIVPRPLRQVLAAAVNR